MRRLRPLRRLRFAFVLASLLPLCFALCLSPAAWAGRYAGPSCTGGSITSSGQYIGTYGPEQNGSYGCHPYGSRAFGASGAITAVFTWVPAYPGEPPPKSVVITETCNVSASANAGGASPSTTAEANNDLGNPTTYGGSPPSSKSASSSGTRYKVVAPALDGSVTLTCSPSASASADAGYPRYSLTSGLSISYWAKADPVTVGLAGTTLDANHADNILIGQGCTGRLNCAVGSFDNYNWTVPGDKFGAYTVAFDKTWAVVKLPEDLDSAVWSQPSPKWFWKKDDTVTVTCTARITIGSFTGTVTGERQIKVWAPYYMFKRNLGPMTIGDKGSGAVELYAGAPGVAGMLFGGRVGTPDLFRTPGVGQWQFIQIIYPNRWLYTTNTFGFSQAHPLNYNGQKCLDNDVPYPVVAGGSGPQPWPADSVDMSPASNEPTYWAQDSPGTGGPIDPYDRIKVDESFDDFMMYQPPDTGNGVQWVPLHKASWKWQADVTRNASQWIDSSGNHHFAPDPPGFVSNTGEARCYDHPIWSILLLNANMRYL